MSALSCFVIRDEFCYEEMGLYSYVDADCSPRRSLFDSSRSLDGHLCQWQKSGLDVPERGVGRI